MAALSTEGQQALYATSNLAQDEKRQVVEEILTANPDLWPTGDKNKTILWITLLGGLFLLALVAIICAVVLAMDDNDATALVALATAVVAGVIGLFSNPPTGR